MPWKGIFCLLVVIAGIILFLYGANFYDALAGWTGVALFLGGLLLYLSLKVYEFFTRKRDQSKTV